MGKGMGGRVSKSFYFARYSSDERSRLFSTELVVAALEKIPICPNGIKVI
jgi:hypothetical protein